jgi:hypothetical protein
MDGPAAHEKYVRDFMAMQFPQGDVPVWAVEALATVDIHIETTLTADSVGGEPQDAKKARVEDTADSAAVNMQD